MTDQPLKNDRSGAEGVPQNGPASSITIARTSLIASAVSLFLILVVVGVGYAVDIFLLVFAGVLLAILLRGIGHLVSRYTPLGDKGALVVAALLPVLILTTTGWLLAPRIAEQTGKLRESLPKAVERLESRLNKYQWSSWALEQAPAPEDLLPRQRDLLSRITGIVSGTISAVGTVFIIFIIAIYFAAQPESYVGGVTKLLVIQKRQRFREIFREIGEALKWWLIGKLISMTFVGVTTWLGLWLLGIDLALTLAILAALFTFIPNFGPIISAIPAVLLGLLQGPTTAAAIVAIYIAIQTIESYLITPLIQQKTLSLPPALTITAQLVMASFVGGAGLALATPLTVVVLVLTRELYVRDVLGDKEPA